MKTEVANGIDELRRQFAGATLTVREDNQGGAYVIMEPFDLGPKFNPPITWMGFHIPAQYPYADIYPVFVGDNVALANRAPFVVPITRGHRFEGRSAIQVSRRNGAIQGGLQRAVAKILKVTDYMDKLS